ncbi:multiple sugar transport system substrate-binding protein [Nocardia transvalensis]|uniref:Multiple sugar transport system substrate-binding protein n=1 Tax=Nocardia transvalensis TaxID=37333 RepID=A0A7W9PER6_9NOCA|nr:extracellular solute-binding protein [Nocardia transvalensis]MBB5914309.1 multiple sugar transport system substrate-binding protein [Nocardia transvalensis]
MKRSLRGAFSSIALLTGLTLAVSSCGFGGSNSDDSDPNTLSFLAPSYSDGTKSEWDQIVADFQKSNPDIKVNVQIESWDSINDVVRTKLQSKSTTPDLLNIDAYSTFAADGQLYPAADVVSPEVLSDIQPGFAKNASMDGTQWALPLFASTRTLFYNNDLFAQAGIAAPPKTWSELTDDAKKIQALGGGVSGYGLPLGSEEAQGETSIWTFGAGGNWSEGDKVTVDTPANVEGVRAMKALADSGVTQPNPGATDRKDVINAFIQGKVGMIEGLPPVIGMIAQKNPNLKYTTAPSPTKTGDAVTLGVADHLMAFKKDGKKTEAIRKFLDYFYSAPVYAKFVQAEHFIPITASGTQAMADDPVVKAFSTTLPVAKFYPSNNPKWGAAQGAIRQQMGTVAQGADPASVLQKIQQAAS